MPKDAKVDGGKHWGAIDDDGQDGCGLLDTYIQISPLMNSVSETKGK
jgi:hypothetical protein